MSKWRFRGFEGSRKGSRDLDPLYHVVSACGLGDLILTCSNDTSRNFTCGKRLREGKIVPEIINELKTVEGLSALEKVDTDNYMVLREIKDLVNHSQQ